MKMVNSTYKSTEDMNNKIPSLKVKTKLKFYRIISNYHDGLTSKSFQLEKDPVADNASGISKIYQEISNNNEVFTN